MQRIQTYSALVGLFLALSGCGGGGGGSKSPTPSTPPPPPTASLTAQTQAMPMRSAWLDETSLTITGSVSWTNLPAGVYIVATDLGSLLGPQKAKLVQATGAYTLTMSGDPAVAPGSYSGSVKVQACQDSTCAKSFNNTVMTLPYSLVVSAVDEWSTYQRTSAHNAYVPITLNPDRFSFKWSWNTTEATGGPLFEQAPNLPAVTNSTAVFTATDMDRQPAYVFAVDKATGKSLWSRSVGMTWAINPPAVSDGIVYIATSGLFPDHYDNSYLWAFKATDGSLIFKSPYPTHWFAPYFDAPTIQDGVVYLNGGKFALQAFAFDAKTGALLWGRNVFDFVTGLSTPTAFNGRLFNAGTGTLIEINKTDGSRIAAVENQYPNMDMESYGTAAVASDAGSILTMSDSAAVGSSYYGHSTTFGAKRAISRYAATPLALSWSTGEFYDSTPVVANGVVYAYRYDPNQLDALDEATGQLLWSWSLPASEGTSFQDNLIVTNNLLFFGTDDGLKAMDLKTRSIAWRLSTPGCYGICHGRVGRISISADRILFLTSGWSITAISLR